MISAVRQKAARLNYNFAGTAVIVIGASLGGIGTAIAESFAAAGADVTITGLEAEAVETTLPYVQLDVTDEKAVRAFASDRPCDVLVNCAAITKRGEELASDFFSYVLDVNLTGSLRCATALHSALSGGGRVINVASMYARFGSPLNPAYGASKAGIEQLTKSLAIAWAPDDIRVNAVAPGFIVTQQSAHARENAAFTATIEARTPLRRWGQPQDVAGVVLFLASDQSAFMTGATVPIDGGYSVV
ncbi:MAG: NAD(P)-dependent dehydrogenase (short-subunit alcohol dehydrogenase family) [Paracoccaceae bacterium]